MRTCDPPVTVDFLIEPEKSTEAQAGRLFDLTKDWAAIIAPGLHLAFKNNRTVKLSGKTIVGETAERDICVCGPGAFVVLKALAFHIRGEKSQTRRPWSWPVSCSLIFGVLSEFAAFVL